MRARLSIGCVRWGQGTEVVAKKPPSKPAVEVANRLGDGSAPWHQETRFLGPRSTDRSCLPEPAPCLRGWEIKVHHTVAPPLFRRRKKLGIFHFFWSCSRNG